MAVMVIIMCHDGSDGVIMGHDGSDGDHNSFIHFIFQLFISIFLHFKTYSIMFNFPATAASKRGRYNFSFLGTN